MGFSETIAPLRGYTARGNVRPIFTSCWKAKYRHSGRMRSTETLIAARALEGSSVLRIPRERFREFLIAEPDIGELVAETALIVTVMLNELLGSPGRRPTTMPRPSCPYCS